MTERSLFWDGTVLGDCGPYVSAQFHDQMLRSITGCTGNRGVLLNWEDSLEVTGTSSPLNVATGAALVYGTFYETDAPVLVTVSTPSTAPSSGGSSTGNSRYDQIVVRRDVALQTARIGKVTGVAAINPTVPTLTQDPTGIYEIPLATILINDSGEITVTDTREYALYSTTWPPGIVDVTMLIDSIIDADKMADQTRWQTKGAGQMRADATNPCTWTVGASYDYWSFATGVTNEAWAYFMAPVGLVGGTTSFYLWNSPAVAAAGNVEWEYNVYYGAGSVGALTNLTGPTVVAQGGRFAANIYRDLFFQITSVAMMPGQIIAIQIRRDGGGGVDNFGQAVQLLAIEMSYTADA